MEKTMIKLCGIRRMEDVDYLNEFPPDYAGFILAEGYKRTVSPELAGALGARLLPGIRKVGVFVDNDVECVFNAVLVAGLDVVQLHGSEDAEYVARLRSRLEGMSVAIWKAVRARSAGDIEAAKKLGADILLIDSFVEGVAGGTGKVADWGLVKNAGLKDNYFLAGGINAHNLREALEVCPNVDISGGIETDGVKDREKIKEIMEIYQVGKF